MTNDNGKASVRSGGVSCWAVVPLKAIACGKSRLKGALPADVRIELIRAMARHVVFAARSARGIDRVVLLGPEPEETPAGAVYLANRANGLNPALAAARVSLVASGATTIVVLLADLPNLQPADVAELAALARDDQIAIAADRAATGTNALALPAMIDFRFAFGRESFARHMSEGGRLRLPVHRVTAASLAFDIDRPDDLAMLDPRFLAQTLQAAA